MYLDGAAGTQSPRQQKPAAGHPPQSASESAGHINAGRLASHERDGKAPSPHPLRRLLSDREAAEVFGIGERTFCAWLAEGAAWLPEPINLGPRLRRWDLDELLLAVRTRAPRGKVADEPAQLRRARIERIKAAATL